MSNIIYKSLGSFEVKAVEGEDRTFTGVASTISSDRVNDILVPGGASYSLPMPLLLHHILEEPVGEVIEAEVTETEIRVKFKIPLVEEEGELKKIVDKAYQSLKYGLIKGLSVGFIADFDDAEFLDEGGIKFNSWEWYELSLVTVPCNRDASIDKSLMEHKYACKSKKVDVESQKKPVKLNPKSKGGVKL